MALTPAEVSDLYSRLPQLRRLPMSIYVVDGEIRASEDPYSYESEPIHKFNAALRDVQGRGGFVIRGMHQANSPSIVVSSTAPASTWVHESAHLMPVIGPNEALTRARTSAMMRMAPFLPPLRPVKYVSVPVSSTEQAAFTQENHLRLASGPGGIQKFVRVAANYDSVWVYER